MEYGINDIQVVHVGKIYDVLDYIKRRPQMMLTERSITALQNFLNGYILLAGWDISSDKFYHPGEPGFDDFMHWILNKGDKRSGVGNPYSNVLLRECNGDEGKAFDRFFEYLEEYKREHNAAKNLILKGTQREGNRI